MQNQTSPQLGSRLSWLALGVAACMLVGRLQIPLAFAREALEGRLGRLGASFLILSPLYLASFLPTILIIKRIPNSPPPGEAPSLGLGLKSLAGWLAFSRTAIIPLSLAGQFLLVTVCALLKVPYVDPSLGMLSYHPVAVFLYTVLVAPFLEELVFRKLLYQKLIGYGSRIYILFSALLFAIYHMSLHQIFYTFGVGLVYGYIMVRTRSFRNTVLLHIANNLLAFLVVIGGRALMPLIALISLALLIWGVVLLVQAWSRNSEKPLAFLDAEPNWRGESAPLVKNSGVYVCIGLYVLSLVTQYVFLGRII